MKKRGPLLAAFCIPLLITLIICVNREIYPFGDQCMLHIDMYHQYCPFFITNYMKSDSVVCCSSHISIRGTSGWERILYPCMRTTLPAR